MESIRNKFKKIYMMILLTSTIPAARGLWRCKFFESNVRNEKKIPFFPFRFFLLLFIIKTRGINSRPIKHAILKSRGTDIQLFF